MTMSRSVAHLEAPPNIQTQTQVNPRLGVRAESLNRPQRVHATAILVLPTIGAVLAGWLAFQYGVSRAALLSCVVMYSVSWIGITVGYHRYFSHRSFRAAPLVEAMLGIFGSIACQGPLNYWVSNHRRHHQCSDQEGDIHSPHIRGTTPIKSWVGFLHSHIGWTFSHEITNTAVIAKDIMTNPLAARVNKLYYLWIALGFLVPGAVCGLVTGTWYAFFEGVLWGGFVRLLLCYHSTNTITSLTHLFGSQPFKSRDQSRNNLWLALPTWGEAWHNNHHAFPTSAIFGLNWWQFDLGAIFIRSLQAAGLAWDVRRPDARQMTAKLNTTH